MVSSIIPNGWQVVELGSISTMKYGKMPKKEDIVDSGYPIFSGYRIVGFHKEYLYENSELVVVARGVGGTGDVKISPPFFMGYKFVYCCSVKQRR
ncbi:MAG: restriction endonuclease subunit S [Geovibrio sp.]|nr:restriction endonuclease subunit S [Geovibrio sp.]